MVGLIEAKRSLLKAGFVTISTYCLKPGAGAVFPAFRGVSLPIPSGILEGYCWSINEWLNPSPLKPLFYVFSRRENVIPRLIAQVR